MEGHRQTFQQVHRDRAVNGVPVPLEHLQDMAERLDLLLCMLSDTLNTHIDICNSLEFIKKKLSPQI